MSRPWAHPSTARANSGGRGSSAAPANTPDVGGTEEFDWPSSTTSSDEDSGPNPEDLASFGFCLTTYEWAIEAWSDVWSVGRGPWRNYRPVLHERCPGPVFEGEPCCFSHWQEERARGLIARVFEEQRASEARAEARAAARAKAKAAGKAKPKARAKAKAEPKAQPSGLQRGFLLPRPPTLSIPTASTGGTAEPAGPFSHRTEPYNRCWFCGADPPDHPGRYCPERWRTLAGRLLAFADELEGIQADFYRNAARARRYAPQHDGTQGGSSEGGGGTTAGEPAGSDRV